MVHSARRKTSQSRAPAAMKSALLTLIGTTTLIRRDADAHGAVTIPPCREAIDGDTAPWNGKVPWPIPFDKPNW